MKLYVKIQGGLLLSVYGDPAPVEIEVILRDMDNIEDGDPDPDPHETAATVYYY